MLYVALLRHLDRDELLIGVVIKDKQAVIHASDEGAEERVWPDMFELVAQRNRGICGKPRVLVLAEHRQTHGASDVPS